MLVGEGVAVLGVELIVDVVGVRGVAEEERLGKSSGVGDLDSRARGAEVLRESLARLEGGQGAWRATVEGERLDVDGVGTVVDDNSLVGSGSSAEDGSKSSEGGELHGDGWFWC